VEALDYLRVVFVTMPLGTLSIVLAMGLRGVGDLRLPLYAMVLTVGIDIGANPLLIRGVGPVPALGITGSALSTALANMAGCALMLAIYARDLPLRLRGAELGWLLPRRSELRFIVAKGLPMGAQMLIVSSAGLIMVGLVNREGVDTAAAYGASMQLWNYLQMPAFAQRGFGDGGAECGRGAACARQHHHLAGAAGQRDLHHRAGGADPAGRRAFAAAVSGARQPCLPIAQHMQPIVIWSFVLMGVMMILTGTMRAYGAVILPLVIMAVSLYPARLGFYFLAFPLIRARRCGGPIPSPRRWGWG
jgi:Na+-driven multidrug efflux pump